MIVKEGEENPVVVVIGDAKCSLQGNLLPSKFQNSKENMIQLLTWSGSKKLIKFLAFIELVLVVLEFEKYAMTWWHQVCMDTYN